MDDLVAAINALYTTARTLKEALEVAKPNHQGVKDLYSQLKESLCPAVRAALHCSAGDEGKTAAAVQGIIQQLNQALLDCRGVVWPWVRMSKSSQVFNKLDLPSLLTKVASALQSNTQALNHLVKDSDGVVVANSEPSSETMQELHPAVGTVLERLEALVNVVQSTRSRVCACFELYKAVQQLKTGSVDDPQWRKALGVVDRANQNVLELGDDMFSDLCVAIPAIMAHINTDNKDVKGAILGTLSHVGNRVCSTLDALVDAGFFQKLTDVLISDTETSSIKLRAAQALQEMAWNPRAQPALRTARVVDALQHIYTRSTNTINASTTNTTIDSADKTTDNTAGATTNVPTDTNSTTGTATNVPTNTTTIHNSHNHTNTPVDSSTVLLVGRLMEVCSKMELHNNAQLIAVFTSAATWLVNMLQHSDDLEIQKTIVGVLQHVTGRYTVEIMAQPFLQAGVISALLKFLTKHCGVIDDSDRKAHQDGAGHNPASGAGDKNDVTTNQDDLVGQARLLLHAVIGCLHHLTGIHPDFLEAFIQRGGFDTLVTTMKLYNQAGLSWRERNNAPAAARFLVDLCDMAAHRQMLLKAGTVPALLGVLGESIGLFQNWDFVRVLFSLVAEDASCQEVITEAGLLHPVVAYLIEYNCLIEYGVFEDNADNQDGGAQGVGQDDTVRSDLGEGVADGVSGEGAVGNAADSAGGGAGGSGGCDGEAECGEEDVEFDVHENDGKEDVEVGKGRSKANQEVDEAEDIDGSAEEDVEFDVAADEANEGVEEAGDNGSGGAEEGVVQDGVFEDAEDDNQHALHEQAKKTAAHRMLAACAQDVPALVDLIRSRTAYILDPQGESSALGEKFLVAYHPGSDVPYRLEVGQNDVKVLIGFLTKLTEKYPACRSAAIPAGAIPALVKALTTCYHSSYAGFGMQDAAVKALAQLSVDQPRVVAQAIADTGALHEVAAAMVAAVELDHCMPKHVPVLPRHVQVLADLVVDMCGEDVPGVIRCINKARLGLITHNYPANKLFHRLMSLLHKLLKADSSGFKEAAIEAHGLIPTLLEFFKPGGDAHDVALPQIQALAWPQAQALAQALALACQDKGAAHQALVQSGVLHEIVETCNLCKDTDDEAVLAACEALVQTCTQSGCNKCLKRKRDAEQ